MTELLCCPLSYLLLPQEEGLKLTFSKQALMPNGSSGEANRKRRKDFEVGVTHKFAL